MTVEVRDYPMAQAAEIEAALNELPQVREAVVLSRVCISGERQAVAYVVAEGPLDAQRLHAHLKLRVPGLAAPLSCVPVRFLPLTVSGQVDEEALARLAVVDAGMVAEWEEQLRSLPEIDEVAVVAGEDMESVPPLHLSDLLPDWKSASMGEAKGPGTAPAHAVQPGAGSGTPAISHGGPLRQDADAPATLPEALKRAARVAPEKGIVYVEPDGTEIFQSYPELLQEAEKILAGLRKLGLKPQDKVLFQLERNQDFIPAFWGCQLGGFVPVPISIAPSYTSVNAVVSKLHSAWQLLGGPVILTDRKLTPAIRSLPGVSNPAELRVATIDELRLHKADPDWHESRPGDLAILLLTSGSTGLPKAVTQNHGSLLSQAAGTTQANDFSSAEVSLNWMPIDHVGGIVMFHLRDVYLGCRQIHVPTDVILQEPLKWLDLIARFRATLTWAPNFAFGLVNAKEAEIRERHWNLSSMRFILNGGEAIVARTARRFLQLLRHCGLSGTCMHPAWGMSETCSGVTYSDGFTLETTSDDDSFVEVGAPIPGFSMRIVDAGDIPTSEGKIGRLQVKGDPVTSGYFLNPGLTQQAFSKDGWFETGDQGLLRRGRLTITGREKDTIIVNGINYHSHEIESVVEEVPGVVISYTAACAVRSGATDTDKVAVFFHPASDDDAAVAGLLTSIRDNVVRRIGINPDYLIPVEKSVIPKTAIGKIQRAQLGQRFKTGEFDPVLKRVDILSRNSNTVPPWFYSKVWRRKERRTSRAQGETCAAIVFLGHSDLGAALCEEFVRRGRPCVRVEPGSDFSRLAAGRYSINPGDPEHYRRLLSVIDADGVRVGQILHLWTYDRTDAEIATAKQLERVQDRGVYSLLFLVQALAERQGNPYPVQLGVVSSITQRVLPEDEVAYEHGSLPGLIRTIPQEMPWLDCRHLDLPAGDPGASALLVLDEMRNAARETEVAYRHGERWVPRLRRVKFGEVDKRELPFKRGGMYLLSGGLGGIGAEIARYLLRQYEARLLVIGRTPLVPENSRVVSAQRNAEISERANTLRELEQLPGAIHYQAIDVIDLAAMQQAVKWARRRWRCDLDGVIHLAGTYHEKLLTEETRDTFESVLRPKVQGTWALAQLLAGGTDKVFISFSSANSSFGGTLVGAYSAANSFLDAYVQHQRRRQSTRSFCLEWSMWDEVGMSRAYTMKELTRSRGYYIISASQGLCSLLAALRNDRAHILIGLDGAGELVRTQMDEDSCRTQKLFVHFTAKIGTEVGDRLRELSIRDRFGTRVECELRQELQFPRTDAGAVDRDQLIQRGRRPGQLAVEWVAPRTELERRIARFWQEVLVIPQVGVHDDFFALGGNSLLSTQVASRIQDAWQVRLSLRTMLEESTVAKLALAVQRHLEHAPATETDVIEKVVSVDSKRMLEKLDLLTDEEVSALLSRTLVHNEKP